MMETGRKLGMPEKFILEKRPAYIGEIRRAKKKKIMHQENFIRERACPKSHRSRDCEKFSITNDFKRLGKLSKIYNIRQKYLTQ